MHARTLSRSDLSEKRADDSLFYHEFDAFELLHQARYWYGASRASLGYALTSLTPSVKLAFGRVEFV